MTIFVKNKHTLEIDEFRFKCCIGKNGVVINKFPLNGPEWDVSFLKSKFNKSEDYPYLGEKRWYDFAKFKKGAICLQDHPGKAYFKNIKIRELY